jgi:flagellar biosynthesis GTPase FlhF
MYDNNRKFMFTITPNDGWEKLLENSDNENESDEGYEETERKMDEYRKDWREKLLEKVRYCKAEIIEKQKQQKKDLIEKENRKQEMIEKAFEAFKLLKKKEFTPADVTLYLDDDMIEVPPELHETSEAFKVILAGLSEDIMSLSELEAAVDQKINPNDYDHLEPVKPIGLTPFEELYGNLSYC